MKSIIGSFLKPPETSLQSTQSLAVLAQSIPASSVQSETAARSESSSPDRTEAPDSTGDAGIEDDGSSATPAPRERTRAPGLWYAGPSRFLMCVTTNKRKSLCPCENCNGKGLCVHKLQKHRYAQVWCVCVTACDTASSLVQVQSLQWIEFLPARENKGQMQTMQKAQQRGGQLHLQVRSGV